MAATVFLMLATVAIGVGFGPAYRLAERAAVELLDPAVYVETVLGAESAAASRGLAGLDAGARRTVVAAQREASAEPVESAEPAEGSTR